jgi:SAM-dependent methyltransferase
VAQNIYDDPGFFGGYSSLARSQQGLDAMPEWPALRALLPPLACVRVADLGCGFGWFCRFAREAGAASVLGLDLSERMLDRARAMTTDTAITYTRADLDALVLPEAAFDLAFSALALHYVADLGRLAATIRRALAPGGRFVASLEHPVFMASRRAGWVTEADGARHWRVDGYQDEGPRVTDWLAPGVVKQHRTLGTTLTTLIRAGLVLEHVDEWGPTAAQVAAMPDLAEERERPMFLLLAARVEG